MLKLSKKADYALIAVKHLATQQEQRACSAHEIAQEYSISSTLMAKVLQTLARHGLVSARHGAAGGYQLAKSPEQLSALEVISAIEGPVQITSCVSSHGPCDAMDRCSVREPLRRVNDGILQLLSALKISQLSEDAPEPVLVELRTVDAAVVGKG
jgi:Rrf2 family protein